MRQWFCVEDEIQVISMPLTLYPSDANISENVFRICIVTKRMETVFRFGKLWEGESKRIRVKAEQDAGQAAILIWVLRRTEH